MRLPHISPTALLAVILGATISCDAEPVSPPLAEPDAAASHVPGGHTLTVDDDRLDCQRADFTTIQEAVTAAEPGTTILVCAGTYHEQVTISEKDDLRLLAKGKPGEVVLDGENRFAGFLLDDAHGNLIQGFLVQQYHEANIRLQRGSSGNTIRKNLTTESIHHDGIQLVNSPENLIEQNRSFANPAAFACGINVAGPGSVGNIIRHNETFDNDFGIQIAAEAKDNVVFENVSHDNRVFGIRTLGGTIGTVIENNRSLDNNGPGIALLFGASGTTVVRNKAFNNDPDLFWDGTGADNEFENNHCQTSSPPGLCEHERGASQR